MPGAGGSEAVHRPLLVLPQPKSLACPSATSEKTRHAGFGFGLPRRVPADRASLRSWFPGDLRRCPRVGESVKLPAAASSAVLGRGGGRGMSSLPQAVDVEGV